MVMQRILDEIVRAGPIGFDRFMEIALYDPDAGYFATGTLRSDGGGDFLTSPEVSPLFGETIGRFVAAEHERIGGPFGIVEVGGGSGSLLRPLVDSLGFPLSHLVAVERSAAARASIGRTVPEAELRDGLPRSIRGVVIANELLDNLPAAVLVRTADGWQERAVDAVDGELGWVVRDPAPELSEWADRYAGPVADGGLVEVQLEAGRWVGDVLGRLGSGALLVFDYGDVGEALAGRRAEGTLRTYRGHHLGPDPLLAAGETDITLDVEFSSLVAVAQRAGASVELLRQDEFLQRWGLRDRLDELRNAELVAAHDNRVMERLILRSRITEGETLLHPRGLGDFRVLVCRI